MTNLQGINGLVGVLSSTYTQLKACNRPDANIETIKLNWALGLLNNLNLSIEVMGKACTEDSLLFVGNHISYLDIPLLLAHANKLSFVAKNEVSKWPLIGPGAKKIGCVFVKRNKSRSRNAAKQALQLAIDNGKRVAIFPSGTTSIHGKKPWKKGAFDVAADTNCLVQPFRLTYTPLRKVAYIDNDFFPTHVMSLHKEQKITAKLEFHDPVKIKDPLKECDNWNEWSNSNF